MREIVLVRHLEPVPGHDDERALVDDAVPGAELTSVVAGAVAVVVSPYRRAQETADRAGAAGPARRTDADVREAPQPAGRSGVRGRVLWLLGRTAGVEDRAAVVTRLRRAADRLETEAADGRIVVVAHGWANLELARILRRRGWRGRLVPRSGHGDHTTYRQ